MKKTILFTMLAVAFSCASCNLFDNDPEDNTLQQILNGIVDRVLKNGQFSVSATKQVFFASGNLRYVADVNKWSFYDNQYEFIGASNSNISATYGGYIDLFGWGTSGYNSKYPYMTTSDATKYGNGDKDIAGTKYDWGVYNAISNGGNEAGKWRTLTYDEWNYLLNTRSQANQKRGQATVFGVKGFILLPDSWTDPEKPKKFTPMPGDWTTNVYTAQEWTKMESAGAVFLPCASYRYGTSMGSEVNCGRYWTSTNYLSTGKYARIIEFTESTFGLNWSDRYYGYSVRLVRDVQ